MQLGTKPQQIVKNVFGKILKVNFNHDEWKEARIGVV